MKIRNMRLVLAILGVFLISACAGQGYTRPPLASSSPSSSSVGGLQGHDPKIDRDDDLIAKSYKTGDELHRQMKAINADASTILYTSFAPVDNLETSTVFGQITAEQVASRMAQNGYQIVEVRLRNALAITESGEFILSRDVTNLAAEHEASAIMIGLYAEAQDQVLVNTRLVSADTGKVMAAYDYSLSKGRNMRALLTDEAGIGKNAEARASIIVIAGGLNKIPSLQAAEELASSHCARRGQTWSLVDRSLEWQRHTSFFRCIDSAIR